MVIFIVIGMCHTIGVEVIMSPHFHIGEVDAKIITTPHIN
jgi:hypothetical protein